MQQSLSQHLRRVKLRDLTISKDQNALAVDDGLQTLHFPRLQTQLEEPQLLFWQESPSPPTNALCPDRVARVRVMSLQHRIPALNLKWDEAEEAAWP